MCHSESRQTASGLRSSPRAIVPSLPITVPGAGPVALGSLSPRYVKSIHQTVQPATGGTEILGSPIAGPAELVGGATGVCHRLLSGSDTRRLYARDGSPFS